MPKYIGYAVVKKFPYFEFEADNDDLAYDHFETLISNKGLNILLEWDESDRPEIEIDQINWVED